QCPVFRDDELAAVDRNVAGPGVGVVVVDRGDTDAVFGEVAGADDGAVEIHRSGAVDGDRVAGGVEFAVQAEDGGGVVLDRDPLHQPDVAVDLMPGVGAVVVVDV